MTVSIRRPVPTIHLKKLFGRSFFIFSRKEVSKFNPCSLSKSCNSGRIYPLSPSKSPLIFSTNSEHASRSSTFAFVNVAPVITPRRTDYNMPSKTIVTFLFASSSSIRQKTDMIKSSIDMPRTPVSFKHKTVCTMACHFSIISCAIFRFGKLAHRVISYFFSGFPVSNDLFKCNPMLLACSTGGNDFFIEEFF